MLAVPVVRDRVLGRRNFTLMERMFRQSNEATPLAMQAAPLNGVRAGLLGGMIAMGVPSTVHEVGFWGLGIKAQGLR